MIRISVAVLLAAFTLGAEMKVGTNEGVRAAVKKVAPEFTPFSDAGKNVAALVSLRFSFKL